MHVVRHHDPLGVLADEAEDLTPEIGVACERPPRVGVDGVGGRGPSDGHRELTFQPCVDVCGDQVVRGGEVGAAVGGMEECDVLAVSIGVPEDDVQHGQCEEVR